MPILQQYYTSFVNQETGRTGFQIKAMSEELSPETQSILSRLIAYRVPAEMDERAIESHPIALRYYYTEQEAILLCSQSSGSDENGRPGNFFAHSLVLSPHSFTYQPPILYWKSSFWKKQVAGANLLIPLSESAMQPSSELVEQMWKFLEDEGRQKAFQQLMCAIVHSKKSNRRIIILDNAERVALWITAVSCMLPPAYRPFLSFSTYHHEPYQSWFLITGTTERSAVHTMAERSSSHFTLDGRTNQTSEVKSSSYASLVKSLCNPRSYRQILLQYFAECEQRFPAPHELDESLEMLAEYLYLRTHQDVALKSAWLPMLKTMIAEFEKKEAYDEADVQELEYWMEFLDRERTQEETKNPEIQPLYESIIRCYRKHQLPTDQVLAKDLTYHTRRLLQTEYKEVAGSALRKLQGIYDESTLKDQINRPQFLKFLGKIVQEANPTQLQDLWTYLGEYIQPTTASSVLITRSIYLWNKLQEQKSNDHTFMTALREGMGQRDKTWFRLPLLEKSSLSTDTLTAFYYQWVRSFSLENREAYREIFSPLIPELAQHEFRRDVARASHEQKLAVLRLWIQFTQQHAVLDPLSLMDEALQHFQQLYRQTHPEQWKSLAAELLLSNDFMPLLGLWEKILVQDFCAGLTLQHFSREQSVLYLRYQEYPGLSEETRQILSGLVAMARRSITISQQEQLHRYLSKLSADSYFTEIDRFLSELLQPELSEEQHCILITTLFFNHYAKFFWDAYWQVLSTMLARLQTLDLEFAVRLFSFWFVLRPAQFPQADQRYVVQQFFLLLLLHLRAMQKFPAAARAFENMHSKAADAPWYPVIQDLFVVRKKNLVEKGQEWMRGMQLRLPMQKNLAEDPEQLLSKKIEKLLQKGKLQERHLRYLQTLYLETERELFWSSYRERVQTILYAGDSSHIIELFTFWFDGAFPVLGNQPYLAQGFLSQIVQICEIAWKEHEGQMKKSMRQVDEMIQGQHSEKKYPWYELIQPYLLDAGIK